MERGSEEISFLLERGRDKEAKSRAISLLRENPSDVLVLSLLAIAQHRLGENDDALSTAQQALSLQPESPEAREILFDVLLSKEEFSDAEQIIIGLLREYPEEADYYVEYADLMFRTLNIEKAELLLAEALRLEPNHSTAHFHKLFIDLAFGRSSIAESEAQKLLREAPEGAMSCLALGSVLSNAGRHAEALNVVRQLVKAFPQQQEFVELAINCRIMSHPLGFLARALHGLGWFGSAALWGLLVISANSMKGRVSDRVLAFLVLIYFLICVYSWVYPPLMRRWIRKVGI